MSKRVPNKKYTPEFKKLVVETMLTGSSKAEAQTRTQHSFINRSTAACDLLLSFETDAESGQIRICEGRDHGNLS